MREDTWLKMQRDSYILAGDCKRCGKSKPVNKYGDCEFCDKLVPIFIEKECKNCNLPIDKPRRNLSPFVDLESLGKRIYLDIKDSHYNSADLCNYCYTLMCAYRKYIKS